MEKWLTLDAKPIAKSLIKFTGGDKRRLKSMQVKEKNSVWGKAAKDLFPNDKVGMLDRLYIFQSWFENRKQLHETFDSILQKKKNRLAPPNVHPDPKIIDEKSHCFCEKEYKFIEGFDMIACDRCDKWVHAVCMDLDITEIAEEEKYICKICTGEVTIPKMFEATVNQPSLSTIHEDDDKALDDIPDFISDWSNVSSANPLLHATIKVEPPSDDEDDIPRSQKDKEKEKKIQNSDSEGSVDFDNCGVVNDYDLDYYERELINSDS